MPVAGRPLSRRSSSHRAWARRTLLALAGLATLAACGGDDPPPPPPPPTIVSLTLKAAPDVNAEPGAPGRPVEVQIFQLSAVNDFLGTDYFALAKGADAALGKALVAEERLVLAPGATEVWQRQIDDKARFVGIAAAYRDIGKAQWRAFAEVPRNQTTLLEAKLDAKGVGLRPAAP